MSFVRRSKVGTSRLGRMARRARLRYQLICAREDAWRLGLVTPSGVWACAPCRGVFLDDLDFVVHAH